MAIEDEYEQKAVDALNNIMSIPRPDVVKAILESLYRQIGERLGK